MKLVGDAVDRVDGRAKVMGTARYAAEMPIPGLLYAVMIESTIPSGTIADIDTTAAERLPGVVTVLTYKNAPKADQHKGNGMTDRNLTLLQDRLVRHDRQPIAVVVADTFERATDAAAHVHVRYDRLPAELNIERATGYHPQHAHGEDASVYVRGDVDTAYASAPVKIDRTYRTPVEHHNPMEPHATIATWTATDRLTVYDATQGVFATRSRLAAAFGLPAENVRVVCPFLGGGFGSKGSAWSHTVLAAMASRAVGRPVKLVLTRPQMFGAVGYRPETIQRIALGATEDGKLVSTLHEVRSQTSVFDEFVEPSAQLTQMLYDVPNVRTINTLVQLNASTPTFMRAPGESSGSFALESAMDELSYAVGLDPVELRLRNHAETDLGKNLPFSSKSLRACYRLGVERFGWANRSPEPRSMRAGGRLVGMGVATATYPTNRSAAAALVRVAPDGSAHVLAGTQDIGTGAYTVFTQVASEALGIRIAQIRFELGDTNYPKGPVSGGSQTTASVGSAVNAACLAARDKIVGLGIADANSPLHGAQPDAIDARDGRIFLRATPATGEPIAALLGRHPDVAIEASADAAPGDEKKAYSMHAFGAQFAEVRVDPDDGTVRVEKMVGVFASGRILNEKTARSQYLGGMVWGVSMALHEITQPDPRNGRIMNANLADYLVPVNADIPSAFEAYIVPEEDEHVNPIGVKGIGEIGIVGGAAAIANAVYHATGKRVRDLPIQPEKLLG
jgi:xanthine dehydrogenase YagR molybdenum-binding subunit